MFETHESLINYAKLRSYISATLTLNNNHLICISLFDPQEVFFLPKRVILLKVKYISVFLKIILSQNIRIVWIRIQVKRITVSFSLEAQETIKFMDSAVVENNLFHFRDFEGETLKN